MKSLYPHSEAYAEHRITVDNMHKLHIEESGAEQGIPVVFLHGGPGSGCHAAHRRFFNPSIYRVILFDQRGAGKSVPLGETEANSTQHLVADLEAIRKYLGIKKWLLFGGSWGVTLSLAYAIKYPEQVLGMILRGIFLGRRDDLQWFFFDLQQLLPQAWQALTENVYPCRSACDLINWYHKALFEGSEALALSAATRWSEWGANVAYWHLSRETQKSPNGIDIKQQNQRLLAKVKIETHYAKHVYFLEENQLLKQISELPPMPVSIVHGVFDITCRLQSAWQLHQSIPGSRFIQLPQAGHLINDPAMSAALVGETDSMRERLAE